MRLRVQEDSGSEVADKVVDQINWQGRKVVVEVVEVAHILVENREGEVVDSL